MASKYLSGNPSWLVSDWDLAQSETRPESFTNRCSKFDVALTCFGSSSDSPSRPSPELNRQTRSL
jgi:hypothetical protein